RPLRATDTILSNDARPAADARVYADDGRITGPKAALDMVVGDVDTFVGTLQPLVDDPVANRAAIVAGIDGFLDAAVGLLERAARFGVPQSGWGFAYEWRQRAMLDLLASVRERVDAWDARL